MVLFKLTFNLLPDCPARVMEEEKDTRLAISGLAVIKLCSLALTDGQSADLVNGFIIADSDSEDPEMWSQVAESWLKSKEQ